MHRIWQPSISAFAASKCAIFLPSVTDPHAEDSKISVPIEELQGGPLASLGHAPKTHDIASFAIFGSILIDGAKLAAEVAADVGAKRCMRF